MAAVRYERLSSVFTVPEASPRVVFVAVILEVVVVVVAAGREVVTEFLLVQSKGMFKALVCM
jgi:hypothetical protein